MSLSILEGSFPAMFTRIFAIMKIRVRRAFRGIIPKIWDFYKVFYFLMFLFIVAIGVVVGVVWALSTYALYVAVIVIGVLLFRWNFIRTKC